MLMMQASDFFLATILSGRGLNRLIMLQAHSMIASWRDLLLIVAIKSALMK